MPPEPCEALGEFLTAGEAIGIATLLAAGQHTALALREVSVARRERAKELLQDAGLGHRDPGRSVAVLHAIAGAKAVRQDLTPVWTMPGNEATVGHLRHLQLRVDVEDVGSAQGDIRTAGGHRHPLRGW